MKAKSIYYRCIQIKVFKTWKKKRDGGHFSTVHQLGINGVNNEQKTLIDCAL